MMALVIQPFRHLQNPRYKNMALTVTGPTLLDTIPHAPSGWSTVSSDLILLVFSRLKPHESAVASLACRRWHQIHLNHIKQALLATLEDTVSLVVWCAPSILTLRDDVYEAIQLDSSDYEYSKRKESKRARLWTILEKQLIACAGNQPALGSIRARFCSLARTLPNFQELRSATTGAGIRSSFLQAFHKLAAIFKHNFKFPSNFEDLVGSNVLKDLVKRGHSYAIWDLLPHTKPTAPSISAPLAGTRLPHLLGLTLQQKGWISQYAYTFSTPASRAKEIITTREFTTVPPLDFLKRYALDFEQLLSELLLAKRFNETLQLCEVKNQKDLWQTVLLGLINSLIKEGKLQAAVDTLLTVVATYTWSDIVCQASTLLLSALIKQNCKKMALDFCLEAHFFQKEFTRDLALAEKLTLFRWLIESKRRYLDKEGLFNALIAEQSYPAALEVAQTMKSCDNELWTIASGYAKIDSSRAREVSALMYADLPLPFRLFMKAIFQLSLILQRVSP